MHTITQYTQKLFYAFTFLLSIVFTQISCQNHESEVLDVAEQLLHDDKEQQAYDLLHTYQHFTSLKDSMRYILLNKDAASKIGYEFKPADEHIVYSVAQYYQEHGDANKKLQAYYLCGRMYADLQWPTEALKWYNKAIQAADTTQRNCDFKTIARVYGQIADISGDRVDDKEFLNILHEGERWCKRANDRTLEADILFSIAEVYSDSNPNLAIKYLTQAQNIYHTFHNTFEWADAELQIARIYINMNQLNEAKVHLDKYNRYKQKFKINDDIAYFQTMALYAQQNKNYNEAIKYNLFILNQNIPYYNITAYQRLANIYQHLGQKDDVIKYLTLAVNNKYSENEAEVGLQLQELQSNFNIQTERDNTQKLETKLHVLMIVVMTITKMYHTIRTNKRRLASNINKYRILKKNSDEWQQQLKLLKKVKDEHNSSAVIQRIEEQKKEAEQEQRQIEQTLTETELITMRQQYLQSTIVFQQIMEVAQSDNTLPGAVFDDLLIEIDHIAQPLAQLLKNKQSELQAIDWQLCLLIVTGLKLKTIKKLLKCTSSKLSMRTRLSEKLFPKLNVTNTSDFDKQLCCWRGNG